MKKRGRCSKVRNRCVGHKTKSLLRLVGRGRMLAGDIGVGGSTGCLRGFRGGDRLGRCSHLGWKGQWGIDGLNDLGERKRKKEKKKEGEGERGRKRLSQHSRSLQNLNLSGSVSLTVPQHRPS